MRGATYRVWGGTPRVRGGTPRNAGGTPRNEGGTPRNAGGTLRGAGTDPCGCGAGAGHPGGEPLARMAARRGGSCRAGERPRRRVSMRYSSPIYCLSPAAQWGSPLSGTFAAFPASPPPPPPPPPAPGPRRAGPLSPPRHTALPVGPLPCAAPGKFKKLAGPAPCEQSQPKHQRLPRNISPWSRGKGGGGGESLNPPPPRPPSPSSPSGSNLPCIVTTARNKAGEAGLQLAIEPLALQTEGLGLLQIHFYFPGQRLYSLLA